LERPFLWEPVRPKYPSKEGLKLGDGNVNNH
jgi:hypothetical protein